MQLTGTLDVIMIRVIIAGMIIIFGAIGTTYAQAKIGPAVSALLAERPDAFGAALILTALPETALVLCFVFAVMILLGIGLV